MRFKEPMTHEQHVAADQALFEIRTRVDAVLSQKLSGRTSAPVVDAALRLHRQLHLLCLRLSDSLDPWQSIYRLDTPATSGCTAPEPQRLTVEEHRWLGEELYDLRDKMMALAIRLSLHFTKSTPVGRVMHAPGRALDSLRCKLDALFCRQHPTAFDTRVYFPGDTRPSSPALLEARRQQDWFLHGGAARAHVGPALPHVACLPPKSPPHTPDASCRLTYRRWRGSPVPPAIHPLSTRSPHAD